jgi:hypothetical protein
VNSLIVAVTPIEPCQSCHHPREVGIMPDRPSVVFATCRTPGCDLESVTLPPDEVLTERQVAGYARVNRQLRERRAKYFAREAARTMGGAS